MSTTDTIPERIIQGDSLTACYALPAQPDDSTWHTGMFEVAFVSHQTQLQRKKEIGNVAIEGTEIKITLTADMTEQLQGGLWKYRAAVIAENTDIVCSVATGILNVYDALQSKPDHARQVLRLLEEILEAKLEGRGDIVSYTIGDRNISTMTVAELRTEINTYHDRVKYTGGNRRTWESWT